MTEEQRWEELKRLIRMTWKERGKEGEEPSDRWLTRFAHVWPLVCEALSAPERLGIMVTLLRAKEKVWFSDLQTQLPGFYKDPAALQHHLNRLALAWLVERTTDLADLRAARDPHFAAYRLTPLGKAALRAIGMIFEELKPVL